MACSFLITAPSAATPSASAAEQTPGKCFALNGLGYSDNVHSTSAGGVDVTPLATVTQKNGDVTYRFQVAYNGVQSSDHRETASTLQIALPPMVEDVKFKQIGSFNVGNETISDETIAQTMGRRVKFDTPVLLETIKSTATDDYRQQFERASQLRRAALMAYFEKQIVGQGETATAAQQAKVKELVDRNATAFGQPATAAEVTALREAGHDSIPGGIVDAGYDYGKFEATVKTDEQIAALETTQGSTPKVKSYLMHAETGKHPVALEVEYTISKAQAKQTPVMPLWAASAWRAQKEQYFFDATFPAGVGSLYGFGKTAKDFAAVANPASIQGNKFDINGLYGTDSGVTDFTGSWYTIGSDITPATFNYVREFNLQANPAVTFLASYTEDYRDIAALKANEEAPQSTRTPEPRSNPMYPDDCVIPANVTSTGGSVDVTPLGYEKLDNGKVKYSFQVSVQAMLSSDYIQNASTFDLAMPSFVEDVNFTQIGTYDIPQGFKRGDYENNVKHAHAVEVPMEILIPTDENYDGGLDQAYEQREKYMRDYLAAKNDEAGVTVEADALEDLARDKVREFGMLANGEELKALEAAGIKHLPGGVIYEGVTYGSFSGMIQRPERQQELDEQYADTVVHPEATDKIKSYLFHTENAGAPLSVRVEYTISGEQFTKTPHMPLWAASAWRSFHEGTYGSQEVGSQNLYEYASWEQDLMFIAHPELINAEQYDRNGLRGTGTGLTQYTGKWYEIGDDVTATAFNYVTNFNLATNPDVQYYAAAREDFRDIAAAGPPPPPRPKPTPEPSPESSAEEAPDAAPIVDTDASPDAAPADANAKGGKLPVTGVDATWVTVLAAALMLGGLALVGSRRKLKA
ncbi:LPXTG cell wall anchor domain-containing protein [Boudabousia marimammalium]|uniref:LPXTG cell wall anchor domain-containing protein n=1 Tax=Boudabousia marimammalium TaxID=156892 RepID=UPI00130182A9|nr:LPXTG cell wall anchor domain-containing protein [Boudabousia marimammalium]